MEEKFIGRRKVTDGLLVGRDVIAGVFGVGRRTLMNWIDQGAPIFVAGRKYQCEYSHVLAWLEATQKPVKMAGAVSERYPSGAGAVHR